MTPRARSIVLLSTLALVGLGSVGCQSTKSPALTQGVKASVSIDQAADALITARSQIGVAIASLRNLTDRPQDAAAQYKVVLAELAKLKDNTTKVAAAADSVRTKGDAYLANWAKQAAAIPNADLREAALNRRGEVSAKLQTIFKSYQDVKTSYATLETDLANIRAVLGSDLSAAGIESIRPFVKQAATHAEPVKDSLMKLAGEFRAVASTLQPSTP